MHLGAQQRHGSKAASVFTVALCAPQNKGMECADDYGESYQQLELIRIRIPIPFPIPFPFPLVLEFALALAITLTPFRQFFR